MAAEYIYTLAKPARTLYASIGVMSAATLPNGQKAEAKFSGTWGIEEEDFSAIVKLMVAAITEELGSFTAPPDYFLACNSGKTAAKRVLQKADFDAAGKSSDEAFKIREKAEKRAELYRPYPGILIAASKFDVSLAQMLNGKVTDIEGEVARAKADKDLFYPGSYTVPSVSFKAFRRKSLEAKDGCTSYLKNCLFIRKGEKIGGAGGSRPNDQVYGQYAGYSDVDPNAGAPSSSDFEDDIAF